MTSIELTIRLQRPLSVLLAGYGRDLPKAALQAFGAALRDVALCHTLKACERAARELERPPTPATLRRLALEVRDQSRWEARSEPAPETAKADRPSADVERTLVDQRRELERLQGERSSDRPEAYPEILRPVTQALIQHGRAIDGAVRAGSDGNVGHRPNDLLEKIARRGAWCLVAQWLRGEQ